MYNVLNGFSNLPQRIIHEPKDSTGSLHRTVFFSAVKVGTEAKWGD